MPGLTDEGFERKTRLEIENDLKQRAKNLFGHDIRTDDDSPLGKILKNISYEMAQAWQGEEEVYNASFVDYASGTSLDALGKLIGIARRDANPARGQQVFEGDDGTTIPEGFLVETEDEIRFFTVESGTIQDGDVELNIEAEEGGEHTNVEANEITEIVNPISGLDETYNPEETIDGRDRETDTEFRQRFEDSLARGGASTVDAIRAELLQIDGVIDAIVRQNIDIEVQNGLPPKSIECLVYGGEGGDIAEAIMSTKAAGIRAYGDEELNVEDSVGNDHVIGYTRPDFVHIDVELAITEGEEYEGDEEVKQAVEDHIEQLSLGDDVVHSRVISAVHNVEGVNDVEVWLNQEKDNIEIADNEVAEPDNIEVV